MTIKHIVLSGGGYNGLYMLGCMNKLLEKEFIDISNVKTIYGTSFGALCGFMLCLKMDWKDIIEYFIERPWEKDIDIKLDLLIDMVSKKGLLDEKIINNLLENCNEINVPEELTYKGQFISLLETYCTGRIQAQTFEEVMLGKPYTEPEESKTYFRLESLMEFMRQKKFDVYTRAQVQERLKEINNGDSSVVKRFKTSTGNSKTIRVWSIPEFASEIEIESIKIEASEAPF